MERHTPGTKPQLKPLITFVAQSKSLYLLACFLLCTAVITIQPGQPVRDKWSTGPSGESTMFIPL